MIIKCTVPECNERPKYMSIVQTGVVRTYKNHRCEEHREDDQISMIPNHQTHANQ